MLDFLKKGVFEGSNEYLQNQKEKIFLKTPEKTFDNPSIDTIFSEIEKLSKISKENYKDVLQRRKIYFITLEFVGKSFMQMTVTSSKDEVLNHIEYMEDLSKNSLKFLDEISIEESKKIFKDFYDGKKLQNLEWESMNI